MGTAFSRNTEKKVYDLKLESGRIFLIRIFCHRSPLPKTRRSTSYSYMHKIGGQGTSTATQSNSIGTASGGMPIATISNADGIELPLFPVCQKTSMNEETDGNQSSPTEKASKSENQTGEESSERDLDPITQCFWFRVDEFIAQNLTETKSTEEILRKIAALRVLEMECAPPHSERESTTGIYGRGFDGTDRNGADENRSDQYNSGGTPDINISINRISFEDHFEGMYDADLDRILAELMKMNGSPQQDMPSVCTSQVKTPKHPPQAKVTQINKDPLNDPVAPNRHSSYVNMPLIKKNQMNIYPPQEKMTQIEDLQNAPKRLNIDAPGANIPLMGQGQKSVPVGRNGYPTQGKLTIINGDPVGLNTGHPHVNVPLICQGQATAPSRPYTISPQDLVALMRQEKVDASGGPNIPSLGINIPVIDKKQINVFPVSNPHSTHANKPCIDERKFESLAYIQHAKMPLNEDQLIEAIGPLAHELAHIINTKMNNEDEMDKILGTRACFQEDDELLNRLDDMYVSKKRKEEFASRGLFSPGNSEACADNGDIDEEPTIPINSDDQVGEDGSENKN